MKKGIYLNLILFIVFLAGTIITIFIIYKDIHSPLATKFIIGYAIFLLLYSLHLIVQALINIRNLTWIQIRKRVFKFIILFTILSVVYFLYYYFFKPSELTIWNFATPFGLSIGLTFSDLMFFRKK